MSAENSREDSWVCVQLTDCGVEDARTVFTTLGAAFGGSASLPDKAMVKGKDAAQVWTSHFDTARRGGGPGSAHLRHPVSAELQGAPCSVNALRRELTGTFAVTDERMAAGDQEEQVWLRLS